MKRLQQVRRMILVRRLQLRLRGGYLKAVIEAALTIALKVSCAKNVSFASID